jgi:BolA protein
MPARFPQSPDSAATVERVRALVQDALRPQELEIRDDSAAHAGHAGAGGGGHFRLHIVSERFVGLSRLERHRLVHSLLAELLDSRIHALALKTDAPGERR